MDYNFSVCSYSYCFKNANDAERIIMVTEAKKRANKKWNDKNKDKMTYFRRKSDSKNFILKYATEEDLDKTLEYIQQRRNDLKSK